MSWWTDVRDFGEALVAPEFEADSARKRTSGLTGDINKGYSALGGAFDRATGRESAADKRLQMQSIAQQTDAYKAQTALDQQQINDARASQDVQKRKIEEKQIRALRNNYRSPGGYLGTPAGGQQGGSSLGSDNTLPSQLGDA
jgi:hypothetical protein